jgi:hypothetical protein
MEPLFIKIDLEEFTTSIDVASIFNNETAFLNYEFVSSDLNEINIFDIINSYGINYGNMNSNIHGNIHGNIHTSAYSIFGSSFINEINNYIASNSIEEILNLSLNESNNIERGENSTEFESVLYSSIEPSEDKECAVCLSEFKDIDMVSITKCTHIFHYDCIKEWYHYKNDCPMCIDIL